MRRGDDDEGRRWMDGRRKDPWCRPERALEAGTVLREHLSDLFVCISVMVRCVGGGRDVSEEELGNGEEEKGDGWMDEPRLLQMEPSRLNG